LQDLKPDRPQENHEYIRLSTLPSPSADAESGGVNENEGEDVDLDKEICRTLAEIRQDASPPAGEIVNTPIYCSPDSSLREGVNDNPTLATDEDKSESKTNDESTEASETKNQEVTVIDALEFLEKRKKLIQVMFTPTSAMASSETMSFLAPAALIAQREREMVAMASSNTMAGDTWSGSLLGRKCLSLVGDIALNAAGEDDDFFSYASDDNRDNEDTVSSDENIYTFVLHEAPSSFGTDLAWTPALVEAIRSYFTLGSISVSDACDGRDVLLALDHFSILYSPEQLVHETFAVHLRVKLWSEYFASRGQLAEWVTNTIMSGRSKLSYSFVTCPSIDDGPIFVGTNMVDIFDGGLRAEGENKSFAIVHDLFVDGCDGDATCRIDTLIRYDFCRFLSDRLPGCRISFDLRTVAIGGPLRESGSDESPTFVRAVLHLDFAGKSKPEETIGKKGEKFAESAACQTAIQTLDNYDGTTSEEDVHPNLNVAPTVVDLDDQETVNVPLRQLISGDICENRSAVSALSSPEDIGLLGTVVEDDEERSFTVPLPPPTAVAAGFCSNSLVSDQQTPTSKAVVSEVFVDTEGGSDAASVAQRPRPSKKASAGCMTMDDLNSQWLLDFINPFTSFVEDTLQAYDSNTVANVQCVLWPSLVSLPRATRASSSSIADSYRSHVQPPPVTSRLAHARSIRLPMEKTTVVKSFDVDRNIPTEAGIEVRPIKANAVEQPSIAKSCVHAAAPVASHGPFPSPANKYAAELNANNCLIQPSNPSQPKTKLKGKSTSMKKIFSKKKKKTKK